MSQVDKNSLSLSLPSRRKSKSPRNSSPRSKIKNLNSANLSNSISLKHRRKKSIDSTTSSEADNDVQSRGKRRRGTQKRLTQRTEDVINEIKLLEPYLSGNGKDFSDKYILGDCIAETHKALIFEATRKQGLVVVAVKIVKLNDVEVISQIIQTIKTLETLDHPNILKYDGAYKQDNKVYMVIEYCEAGSINEIYEDLQHPLTETQIILMCYSVLKALEYIHAKNIVHRNIKGSNILLTRDGKLKLDDFGLSGYLTDKEGRSNSVGTPYWMAPEIIATLYGSTDPYDEKVDIWSLGITAVECCQCDPPHSDLDPEHALCVIHVTPPPALVSDGPFSPNFVDFVSKCLIKDPQLRPSAKELLRHPVFTKLDFCALDAIASVVDTWDDWTWEEDSDVPSMDLLQAFSENTPDNSVEAVEDTSSNTIKERYNFVESPSYEQIFTTTVKNPFASLSKYSNSTEVHLKGNENSQRRRSKRKRSKSQLKSGGTSTSEDSIRKSRPRSRTSDSKEAPEIPVTRKAENTESMQPPTVKNIRTRNRSISEAEVRVNSSPRGEENRINLYSKQKSKRRSMGKGHRRRSSKDDRSPNRKFKKIVTDQIVGKKRAKRRQKMRANRQEENAFWQTSVGIAVEKSRNWKSSVSVLKNIQKQHEKDNRDLLNEFEANIQKMDKEESSMMRQLTKQSDYNFSGHRKRYNLEVEHMEKTQLLEIKDGLSPYRERMEATGEERDIKRYYEAVKKKQLEHIDKKSKVGEDHAQKAFEMRRQHVSVTFYQQMNLSLVRQRYMENYFEDKLELIKSHTKEKKDIHEGQLRKFQRKNERKLDQKKGDYRVLKLQLADQLKEAENDFEKFLKRQSKKITSQTIEAKQQSLLEYFITMNRKYSEHKRSISKLDKKHFIKTVKRKYNSDINKLKIILQYNQKISPDNFDAHRENYSTQKIYLKHRRDEQIARIEDNYNNEIDIIAENDEHIEERDIYNFRNISEAFNVHV
eukprot:TRINITY_DN7044_c0_g1_i2.p1 TRINITY_DN7044_c0_g1~~TRINITY_DN7044_c0_g1_i2.p1  ORF type:complete len:985 (+),score=221.29 TRINITY_DN7044_c0_g1_i2:37-2991(+)